MSLRHGTRIAFNTFTVGLIEERDVTPDQTEGEQLWVRSTSAGGPMQGMVCVENCALADPEVLRTRRRNR
jgi:hypothetical protein